MSLVRHTRRVTAWIAIFAILMAALAPSLARALSSSQKAMPWSEICSVVGTQAVPDAASAPGSGRHDGADFKHCPFCLSHAGHFALPAAPHRWLPAAVASAASFPPVAATPSPRFMRAAAQPRAPPANS